MVERKKLILIDGHALAYREFFALERTGMKTSDNEPSWAVYGFFKALFDLLKNQDVKPDALGVAFDVGRRTFRTEKYEEYKANRETMPDSLKSQMSLIFEGLKAFNIPIYTKEGFEADDVIGTISAKATKLGHKTLILTGDQDSFQLVDREGFVKVLIPTKGELVEYDWYKVHEKLGVYPNQVIDYKGLRGDSSDNIPGIKGIGEKTAQKLLSTYSKMEDIYDNIEDIQGKAVKQRLIDGKDIGMLSKELATIIRDVEIDFDFEKAHVDLPDISSVTAFLQRMQFYKFIKSIDSILSTFDKNNEFVAKLENKEIKTEETTFGGQLGLFSQEVKQTINKDNKEFEKTTVSTEEDLKKLVTELSSQSLISFNIETTSDDFMEAELVGLSFGYNSSYVIDDSGFKFSECSDCTKTFYIPISHQFGDQLELELVLNEIKPILENPKIKKTLNNTKFDYNILKNYKINLSGIASDVILAGYIKDPSRKGDIETFSLDNLNYIVKEREDLVGFGKNQVSMECVSVEDASPYECDIAYATLELTKYWNNSLDEKELKLLYDVEVPVAVVLAKMEYVGVSIDTEYLNELSLEFSERIKVLEKKIFEIAGEEFNINSPKQVGEILFEKMQIAEKKKKKGSRAGYSTSASVLEELAPENEICGLLLENRKLSKLRSTYTDALPLLISNRDERIHTSYNQTVTLTGRLSSSNPNLQNIPIRTEEGNKIRTAFVPRDRDNYYLLSADYSQIELRLLAHCSEDENLVNAFCNEVDVHTLTASKVFDVEVDKVTKDMRRTAKTVNFGIIYGQTKYGLAKLLKISPLAAGLFIEKYFETYPKVKDYMQNTVKFAYKKGYVETIFGRRRYMKSELSSRNKMIREFAERAASNQPLQGSAADLIKMAMIDLSKKLDDKKLKSKMIMQVHDELILEVPKEEIEEVNALTAESMELGQPLRVPLLVDAKYGKNWFEK